MRSLIRFGLYKTMWPAVVLACCAFLLITMPCTAAEKEFRLDFDDSDPIELSAPIMEIQHGKAQLVVAEEVIYIVDFMIGDQHFFTEIVDAKGDPGILAIFKKGDFVLVKGFKTSDGIVFASLLQKVKKQPVKRKFKDRK